MQRSVKPTTLKRRLLLAAAVLLAALPLCTLDVTGRELAWNTAWLVGVTLAFCLPLGTALAWLLFRTNLPGRRLWLVLLTLQLFVPLYLHAAAWDAGFGLRGWFTLLADRPDLVLLERWRGAVWVHVVNGLPWVVLIVGAGMRLVERHLEEDALLLSHPGRVLRHVTLPRSGAAIGVAALWVGLLTAGEMTATNVFRVRTYTEEVYLALANWAKPSQAVVIAWPLFGIILCAAWMLLALCLRHSPRVRQRLGQTPLTFSLEKWRWPAAVAVALVLGLVILLPLGSLVYRAGMTLERSGDEMTRHWSAVTAAAITARSSWESRIEFGWSLRLAAWTALWAVLLALPLAWRARGGGTVSQILLAGSALAWAMPGPIVALYVAWLLNRHEAGLYKLYDKTLLAPIVAMVIRTVPLAAWIIWAGFRAVPTVTLEAAATDGAGPWTTFRRVALPLSWRAVLSAATVVFIVAMGDLATSILLLPPRAETVARKLFGLIHSSTDDQTAGLSLALLAVLSPLTLLATIALRRVGRRAT